MKKLLIKNYKYLIVFLIIFFTFFVSSASAQYQNAKEQDPEFQKWLGKKSLGEITGLSGFQTIGIDQPGSFLETVFSNLLGVFTVIAGLMFLIYFILGAISWITAEGDPEKVKKAQKQLTNAVLGLVLVVLVYSIAFILDQVLGLNILNPAEDVKKLGPNQ